MDTKFQMSQPYRSATLADRSQVAFNKPSDKDHSLKATVMVRDTTQLAKSAFVLWALSGYQAENSSFLFV